MLPSFSRISKFLRMALAVRRPLSVFSQPIFSTAPLTMVSGFFPDVLAVTRMAMIFMILGLVARSPRVASLAGSIREATMPDSAMVSFFAVGCEISGCRGFSTSCFAGSGFRHATEITASRIRAMERKADIGQRWKDLACLAIPINRFRCVDGILFI